METENIVRHFKAFGCTNVVQVAGPQAEIFQPVLDQCVAEALRIERKYSRYRDDSVTAEINRSAGKYAVRVDNETLALLEFADNCYRESEGVFDLTSGVLRHVWDFAQARVPTEDEIARTLAKIGWSKIAREGESVFLTESDMEVDFGGIGKEYAADRLASILTNNGIKSGVVNLGGDVRVLGPRGPRPWRIGIAHPRRAGDVIAVVEAQSVAIATSGDYERFFERGGERYCHIFNARTGWPNVHFQSVTIIADSTLAAGAIATMCMLLEAEQARKFLEGYGVSYLLVDQTGKCTGCNVATWQGTPDVAVDHSDTFL